LRDSLKEWGRLQALARKPGYMLVKKNRNGVFVKENADSDQTLFVCKDGEQIVKRCGICAGVRKVLPTIAVSQKVSDELAAEALRYTLGSVEKNCEPSPVIFQVVPDGYYYGEALKDAKISSMAIPVIAASESGLERFANHPGNIIICDSILDTGEKCAKILLVLRNQQPHRKYYLAFQYLKEDYYALNVTASARHTPINARWILATRMAHIELHMPEEAQIKKNYSWIQEHILSFYAASCPSRCDMSGWLILPGEGGNPIESQCSLSLIEHLKHVTHNRHCYVCFSSDASDYEANQVLLKLLNYMSEIACFKSRVSYGICDYPAEHESGKMEEVFVQDTTPANRDNVYGFTMQLLQDHQDHVFSDYCIGLPALCDQIPYPTNPVPLGPAECISENVLKFTSQEL